MIPNLIKIRLRDFSLLQAQRWINKRVKLIHAILEVSIEHAPKRINSVVPATFFNLNAVEYYTYLETDFEDYVSQPFFYNISIC